MLKTFVAGAYQVRAGDIVFCNTEEQTGITFVMKVDSVRKRILVMGEPYYEFEGREISPDPQDLTAGFREMTLVGIVRDE